ncbi:MAG: 30S ribosomal protein S4 [Chloroflexi bacterium]|nr:30S ribosomal protein S4 [Chloroflexota bacterium]
MARYTGPVCRLCRRLGDKLLLKGDRCLTAKCAVERRGTPPGPHLARRRKLSERGIQLREKQRARFVYGILERQFRKIFGEAESRPGITGEVLLQLLERRLDNVVHRLGFAESRAQARQLVRHGHIALNNRKTDIPSAIVKVGDTISWMPASIRSELYKTVARDIQSKAIPSWLSLDMQTLTGRVVSLPSRSDIDTTVDEHLIVEWYSR